MAISIGTMLLLAKLAQAGASIGSSAYNKYREIKDPKGFERAKILKTRNITPEQYDLSKQNLQQALGYLGRPQSIFRPQQGQPGQFQRVSQDAPGPLTGGQQFAPLGGLTSRLRGLESFARKGYEQDYGREVSGLAQSNPLGLRSSRDIGLLHNLRTNAFNKLGRSQFGLLSKFAGENAIRDIEGENLGMTQEDINRILQNQTRGLQNREQQLSQQNILGQRGRDITGANLRNTLETGRGRQANRRLQIGLQDPYKLEVLPEGVR